MSGIDRQTRQPPEAAPTGGRDSLRLEEATMLAEIILLRLEFAVRAMHESAPQYLPFVPICPGMVFKHSRTRH